MHLASIGLMALAAMSPTLAAASDRDFVPGQERQVVYYSVWGDCIGNPRTPVCAMETLFSCMVRSDWDMCATVGVPVDTDCRPSRITGVRYIVDRVTETETVARMIFRAEVCRDDRPCRTPTSGHLEVLEKTDGRWRFRETPLAYRRACRIAPGAPSAGVPARRSL